jgi:hypothetical protein
MAGAGSQIPVTKKWLGASVPGALNTAPRSRLWTRARPDALLAVDGAPRGWPAVVMRRQGRSPPSAGLARCGPDGVVIRSEGAERRDFYPGCQRAVPAAYRSPQSAGLPPTLDVLTRGLAIPARRPESAGDAAVAHARWGLARTWNLNGWVVVLVGARLRKCSPPAPYHLSVPPPGAALAKSRGSLRKLSTQVGGPAVRILLPPAGSPFSPVPG